MNQLNKLEQQAIKKRNEKDKLKELAVSEFRSSELDEDLLRQVIERAFILGHNAGYCQTESLRNYFGLDEW